jgi:protein-ribulosamine 3-kinase
VLKTHQYNKLSDLYQKEHNALTKLSTAFQHIPETIATGKHLQEYWLVQRYVRPGRLNNEGWTDFAQQLAQMHRNTQAMFGYEEGNYMATLPQINSSHEHWNNFFVLNRLEPMLRLAHQQGLRDPCLMRSFDRLFIQLDNLIPPEPPSLVHGDLWSGNVIQDEHNSAWLIDPAVYYGHREMDLAMTRLFGGFSPIFLDAYQQFYPVEKGLPERIAIHNLYPLLVHLVLFGNSYLSDIRQTMKRYA